MAGKKTLELVLTGEMVSAEKALQMGLVNQVVADDQLQQSARKLAETLAEKSPLALKIGKEGINRWVNSPCYDEGLMCMDDLFATLCSTQDAKRGKAFMKKRKPTLAGTLTHNFGKVDRLHCKQVDAPTPDTMPEYYVAAIVTKNRIRNSSRK